MHHEPLDPLLESAGGAFRTEAEPLTRAALVQLALVLGSAGVAACIALRFALDML